MIQNHGRYDYSPIISRKDYSWPQGKRLAVYLALNVEIFSFGEGKGSGVAPNGHSQSHSVYSWRDYGNRVGIWRLLKLFEELNIPFEAQINSATYNEYPIIPEKLRKYGAEILGHGITNSDEQGNLKEENEREMIQQVTKTIKDHEGKSPIGWMSPWFSCSKVTHDLLQEAGYRYILDWTSDDQPFWIKTRNGRILSIPYPIESNDNRGIIWFHYSSSEFAEMLVDQFDEMLKQSSDQPLVCPFALHPFVVGRPYRIKPLRKAFEHIFKKREKVWFTQPGEICKHIESLPDGIVPGSN